MKLQIAQHIFEK